MATVTLPYTLTAGTPENVNNLMANLNALVAGANTVDTAQIAARAVTAAKIEATVVPAGMIVQFAGSTAPTDWLICNGDPVSRSTYAALFTAISTGYGVGDGSTTFNLPDLRGRIPVGKGTHADVDALNDNDGSTVANRSPKHQHTVYDPTHGHGFVDHPSGQAVIGGAYAEGLNMPASYTGGSALNFRAIAAASTGVKVNPAGASSSSSPTDTPAYVVVNYIIRAV
jgi:microcystin-dependent protein